MTSSPASDALLPAEENFKMFDRIVPRYDRLNFILSLGLDRTWRQAAIRALEPTPRGRYLDLGCGTGALGFELLDRAAGARVIGIDPSRLMLAQAARKAGDRKMPGAFLFAAGDARRIGLAASSVDGVVTGFCLRNVTDHAAALREMRRVTRPGGRLVILELTKPRSPWLKPLHHMYSRVIVPLVGGLLSRGEAYKYLVDSIENFPAPDRVLEIMREAGWSEPVARPLTGGIVTLFAAQAPS